MSTNTNYVDPKDERLVDAEKQGEDILNDYKSDMNSAISSNNKTMEDALDEIGEMGADGKWTEGSATDKLMDAQNAQTEFAIDEIERQKEQAEKDYTKEQTGAYVDWQKQSNQYGANAEQMAAQGMQNTGYSESSKVSMYNQYQARITAARESFVRISQDYDNAMTNARLQNNSALAQIAADAMKQRLEIMLQFSMQNTELLTTMAQGKANLRQQNFANYMSVYNQLFAESQHTENIRQYNESLAENKRQFNASLAETARQHNESLALQRDQFNWQKEQAEKSSSGGSGGGSSIKKKGSSSGSKSSGVKSKSEIVSETKQRARNQVPSFKSYEEAAKYLNKKGISGDGGLMTKSEWTRRKQSGSNRASSKYSSYSSYLRSYVVWKLANPDS